VEGDLVNAMFEGLAALMVANHCRVLLRERCVRGVSLLSVLFFTLWGLWTLHYYPALGQSLSGTCAGLVTLANATYLGLALYFRRTQRRGFLFWEIVE